MSNIKNLLDKSIAKINLLGGTIITVGTFYILYKSGDRGHLLKITESPTECKAEHIKVPDIDQVGTYQHFIVFDTGYRDAIYVLNKDYDIMKDKNKHYIISDHGMYITQSIVGIPDDYERKVLTVESESKAFMVNHLGEFYDITDYKSAGSLKERPSVLCTKRVEDSYKLIYQHRYILLYTDPLFEDVRTILPIEGLKEIAKKE